MPKDHFLRKLGEVVDWGRWSQRLASYYKGGAEYGPTPYEPALLLKMLLISYLYNLSERQTEELGNDSLSVKCFLGLAADERAPDHSTLSLFKARLLKGEGTRAYEALVEEVVSALGGREKGVVLGRVSASGGVDSVHSITNVSVAEDERRRQAGDKPRDPDARWGVKGSKGGQPKYFYGYKQHVSLNAETGLITSVYHTEGSAYDGHQLQRLIEQDLKQGIRVEVVAADRGYDDGENHYFLELWGIGNAICLNDYRTSKGNPHREGWLALKKTPEYEQGLRERYKVEQKFGEMKSRHGLGRCRYVGLARYAVQGCLTAMVVNLKRIVKLLFGVRWRNQRYPMPVAA